MIIPVMTESMAGCCSQFNTFAFDFEQVEVRAI